MKIEEIAEATNPPPTNNYWYKLHDPCSVVFVFVHGFFSSSAECWKSKSGIFWPDLIDQDRRLGKPSIYLAGYYTAIDSGSYEISDCAAEVFSAISRSSANGEPAPIHAKNIVFVCHSLGGIVTRYMLESQSAAFADKSIGLLLLASPSLGSSHADMLEFFANLYKNRLGDQLKLMNVALLDLDKRFSNLLDSKKIANIVGAEAIEHKSLFGWRWFPPLKPIVEKVSASRYFGNNRTLPGTNHSTIVKPDCVNHQSHLFLIDFYSQKFLPIIQDCQIGMLQQQKEIETTPSIHASTTKNELVLFDILGKANVPYYLRREFDGDLENNLIHRSVWVSGPSGWGKTSAIRYYLETKNRKPLDICLSHCNENSTRNDFIAEIIATANQLELLGKNNRPTTYHAVVALLSEYSVVSSIVLHLDEIPVSREGNTSISDLLNLIADLLSSVKQRVGRSDLRFVISSIYEPNISSESSREKLTELLSTVSISPWTKIELAELLDLIIKNIPELTLSPEQQSMLINASSGSPRFIKNFLKDLLVTPLDAKGFKNALAKTESEMTA